MSFSSRLVCNFFKYRFLLLSLASSGVCMIGFGRKVRFATGAVCILLNSIGGDTGGEGGKSLVGGNNVDEDGEWSQVVFSDRGERGEDREGVNIKCFVDCCGGVVTLFEVACVRDEPIVRMRPLYERCCE